MGVGKRGQGLEYRDDLLAPGYVQLPVRPHEIVERVDIPEHQWSHASLHLPGAQGDRPTATPAANPVHSDNNEDITKVRRDQCPRARSVSPGNRPPRLTSARGFPKSRSPYRADSAL